MIMYYIIVNPASKSGRGAKIWSMLEPVLNEREIEYRVLFSRQAGHVISLVRDLCVSNLTPEAGSVLNLIVLGGDGTLNETLQGITDFDRVRIGYIPTGSSNDMARDLRLSKDPLVILEQILACREPLKMDLGCLTYESVSDQLSRQHSRELTRKRYFAVSAGIGYDAAVCEEALASKFKNVLNKIGLGKLTYLTIALKQLITTPKVTCEILLDEKTRIHLPKFLFVAGMIHKYEGGGFKFCPAASFQDGRLNVCVVGNIPKWLVLIALPTAFSGKHYRFKGIDHYTAEKLSIQTSAPLWVHTDGEVSIKSDAITITCEKEKIQLLK